MVSDGNHPLKHYDEFTLEEFVLGQLLPDEEENIRQHLAVCISCRAQVAELQALCRQVGSVLHRTLDEAEPNTPLRFDRIASEWHKPPHRISLSFRLQQLIPNLPFVLLIILLIVASMVLLPGADATALRRLDVARGYDGPPARVAALSDSGLVILSLSREGVEVVAYLDEITMPRRLLFSPDGNWLAFQQGRTLHVMESRAGGSHYRIALYDNGAWAWSPDSQALAYTDGGGQLGLFEVPYRTHRVLVPAEESAWGTPVWSDDGHQIAYATVEPVPAAGETLVHQAIWRVTPGNGYRVELVRNPQPAEKLLAPAGWIKRDTALLVWDVNAGMTGEPVALYEVSIATHRLGRVLGDSVAVGQRLLWPLSAQHTAFAIVQDRLVTLRLDEGRYDPIPDEVPLPQAITWAPNGAWAALIVPGQAEGASLFLYAPDEGTLRPIQLPAGATEKAVIWIGAETLFVIRQQPESDTGELWLVSLTTDRPPKRILSNVALPPNGERGGWHWENVLAARLVSQ